MIRSQNEIYECLDKVFDSATEPLTCVDIMENPEVRAAAVSRWGKDIQEATEKLSDTLGFMWRRGIIDRFAAPLNPRNKARYAYAKKKVVEDLEPVLYEPKVRTKNKGDLEIVERDGEIVLNFEKFTIVIKPR
jgi:hypothetical protein